MQFLLRLVDAILVGSGDVYFIFASAMSSRWCVTIKSREWWWEIDGCVRCRLDKANVSAGPTTNDCVQGQFELHHVDLTVELRKD